MTTRSAKNNRNALMEILTGIANHAAEQANTRCPYRNKHDECTAKFSCRNQRPADDDSGMDRCGHDGPFDYRIAWETRPQLYEKAKSDIARNKLRNRAGHRRGRHEKRAQLGEATGQRNVTATTLFDLAETRGLKLASSCKRLGECHECIVDVSGGMAALSPRSEEEAFLGDSFRLACQATILDDDS
ncbi:MAG: 2Fe-2S iron-sulfur cluster-binding protein, partial [Alphaproteobacteria bacterium]